MTDASTPPVVRYPLDACPHLRLDPKYLELQRTAPVTRVWVEAADREGWLVTSHKLVKQAWRSPYLSRAAAVGIPGFPPLEGTVLGMDGTMHARVRSALAPLFAPARVEGLRPLIEQAVQERVAALDCSKGPVDLVQTLAMTLPLFVISEIMGLPEADRERFMDWADSFVSLPSSPRTAQETADAQVAMFCYLAELIETRRREPGTDALSEVLAGGETITSEELAVNSVILVVAGFETTTAAISIALFHLLAEGGWAGLADGTVQASAVAQESIRAFPIGSDDGLVSIATQDFDLGGALIREGDMVLISGSAANQDPAVFTNPEEFSPGRPGNLMAFGHGPHFCMGSQLALMEIETVLKVLAERLPGLRLAVPPTNVVWKASAQRGTSMRGPVALPAVW